jgi:hypothetical protein
VANTDCQYGRCGDLIPEERQKKRAKYCSSLCQSRAAEERKMGKKGTPEPEFQPEGEGEEESVYAEQVEALREAKERHAREIEAAIAAEPKKRGNKSWKPNKASKLYRRDILAVTDMEGGRHPKDPTGYYTWVKREKIDEKITKNYNFASRKKLGIAPAQNIVGTGNGTSPDQIWRNEMVLMRQPLKQYEDKREFIELETEANSPDMEDYARRMGFYSDSDEDAAMIRKPRHGDFGRGQIAQMAYAKRMRDAKRREQEMDD